MTAQEALFERVHTHPALLSAVASVNPADEVVLRPARWNAAGYCVMCLDWNCQSERCNQFYANSVWVICRYCDGSGYDSAAEQICNCTSGLVDLTYSEWVNKPRPRPARLNFAGFCLWCDQRWCDNPECITSHRRYPWIVCNRCDGHGFKDLGEPCSCAFGLIEGPR